jgi:hypothetical protein
MSGHCQARRARSLARNRKKSRRVQTQARTAASGWLPIDERFALPLPYGTPEPPPTWLS